MTIGLLLDDTLDKPDGVQQSVVSIGQELRRRGHLVHYIVTQTDRTDLDNIHSMSKYFSIKFNGNTVRTPFPVRKSAIKKLLNEIDFDVLHVQMPYSPLFSAKVLRLSSTSVKKFGTFHILPYNNIASIGTRMLGLYLYRNKKLLNHSFAVSGPAQKFMKSGFGLAGSILPNPVDHAFYSSFKRQTQSKKQIVFVGRFDARKGVRQLVDAFSMLPLNIRSTATLTMCGKGPLLDDMRVLAAQNDVDIEFPGFVTDEQKAQYLANADIAVFPSVSGESFGIVLTEAMSAGSGVTIGGSNPGYASVLEPWPEALFDPKNTKLFSDKLNHFLLNDKERTLLGEAQHDAVKQYDIKLIVDRLVESYGNQ
jgi:phosphatidylinositol alpha-mannosyltransferase